MTIFNNEAFLRALGNVTGMKSAPWRMITPLVCRNGSGKRKTALFRLFRRVLAIPPRQKLSRAQCTIREDVYETGGNLGILEDSAAYYGKLKRVRYAGLL